MPIGDILDSFPQIAAQPQPVMPTLSVSVILGYLSERLAALEGIYDRPMQSNNVWLAMDASDAERLAFGIGRASAFIDVRRFLHDRNPRRLTRARAEEVAPETPTPYDT